jgi:hypothetical protein
MMKLFGSLKDLLRGGVQIGGGRNGRRHAAPRRADCDN